MNENQPATAALPKRRFKITKQGVLTFVGGMALALLLGVGIQAAVNPTFMEGTTSAAGGVTLYQMFYAKGVLPENTEALNYCGEVTPIYIPAGNSVSTRYYMPYSGQSMKVASNTALYAVLNGGVGEDSSHTNFYLPNFNQTPFARNITYFLPTSGAFPYPFGSAEKIAGDIAYVAAPLPQTDKYSAYNDYTFIVGQVYLLQTKDRELLSGDYLACEGQLLKVEDYPIFNATVAPEQTVFRVPDLSDQSPMEGAEFYICLKGIYVYTK